MYVFFSIIFFIIGFFGTLYLYFYHDGDLSREPVVIAIATFMAFLVGFVLGVFWLPVLIVSVIFGILTLIVAWCILPLLDLFFKE